MRHQPHPNSVFVYDHCFKLTHTNGLRQIIDINSHFLCSDHTSRQRECIPFSQSIKTTVRYMSVEGSKAQNNN